MRWKEHFSFCTFYFLLYFFYFFTLPLSTVFNIQTCNLQQYTQHRLPNQRQWCAFIFFTLLTTSSTYFCFDSNSKYITWQKSHTPPLPVCVSDLDLSPVYPCLCSFCLFSVQACECKAVRWWRAPLGYPELLHPLPAPLLALPVVILGCLPTWQLQRTTGKERYDGVKSKETEQAMVSPNAMKWAQCRKIHIQCT